MYSDWIFDALWAAIVLAVSAVISWRVVLRAPWLYWVGAVFLAVDIGGVQVVPRDVTLFFPWFNPWQFVAVVIPVTLMQLGVAGWARGAKSGDDYMRVSNLYVRYSIAKKAQGDRERAAAVGLKGARAAELAAVTYRGASGASMARGDDNATLEASAKQAMRNAIQLAEDVARMHTSSSKEAASDAHSWRATLANWWPGE